MSGFTLTAEQVLYNDILEARRQSFKGWQNQMFYDIVQRVWHNGPDRSDMIQKLEAYCRAIDHPSVYLSYPDLVPFADDAARDAAKKLLKDTKAVYVTLLWAVHNAPVIEDSESAEGSS